MAMGVGSLSRLTGFLGVLALLSSLLVPAAAVPAPAAGALVSPAAPADERHAATAISGQVFIDTNRNTLADGDEIGVDAVTLFVDMDGDGVRGSADLTTSTSESGAYTLPVAGGTGVVCVEPPAHLTSLAPRCRFARGEATDFPLVTIPGGCAAGALMAPIGAIASRDAPDRFYRPLDLIGTSAAPPPAGSRLEYHGATLVTLVQRDEIVATRLLLSAAASQQADLVLRLRYQRSYQAVGQVRAAGGAVARMADPTAPLPVDFATVDRDGELLISGLPRDAAGRYLDLTVETRITADRGYLTTGAGIAGRVVDGRLTPVGNTCGDGSDSVIATGLGGPRPGAQPVSEAVLIVTTAADDGPGSLRQALTRANATTGHDTIIFAIPGSAPVIAPTSPLPHLTGPATIDGTTQPGGVTLDGVRAGPAAAGLALGASGSLLGLTIRAFTGDGVVLDGDTASLDRLTVIGNGDHGVAVRGRGATIVQATIVDNGGTGIAITGGASATVRDSSLAGNGGLGIDLGDDGPTPNDVGDGDSGPNGLQNAPVVVRATPASGGLRLEGLLNSAAGRAFTVEFFAAAACDPSGYGEGDTLVGRTNLTTAANGVSRFSLVLPVSVPEGHLISATATDAAGNTSEFGRCAVVSPPNDTWTGAEVLALAPVGAGAFEGVASRYLDRPGQARWFKFTVQPNSRVIVRLSHLPANYDLALYKDIADAYQSLTTPADLVRLGAEFAPDSFSPDAFSPDAFSPDAFSPDAFSPDAFSPDSFSPDSFSPDSFSPDSFSPDAFSPDAFSPDAFSPDSFSPDAFSPDAFSPDSFSPDSFSPLDFVSAQTRSLLGVSAFEGTGSEGLIVNTWDNDGDFYVRVRGRNGAFSLAAPFQLQVTLLTGACAAVGPVLPATSLIATARGARTIIVTDLARLAGTATDKAALTAALAALAGRVEIAGVVVDVGSDARVVAANTQADTYPSCPHAKNLVAGAIKDVIDRYRAANPLEYIVLVGNDGVIPFFRHPEGALLASERGFVPPVLGHSPSQASLRLGYILSQDRYGAVVAVSRKADRFPVPGLAVGRLVETAADITALIGAYLTTSDGVAPTPTSALVTGYDFLADAATAIQQELQVGLGRAPDTLIADRDWSPADPRSWTADQLRAALLGTRHDLIFLAGHFSANRALAADYSTRLTAADLVTAPVDLTNSVVWSIGCHAGYNIVDADGVPGVTLEPDWPQAFARKGAVLVAGTGYQYGDTATIEYSERLYVEFARRLRAGQGPVAVGKALVAAKLAYLSATPELRGLHEKSLLQATLYGLPMLAVNLPAGRGDLPPDLSVVGGTIGYARDPGQTLGLRSAEMSLTPALAQRTVSLREPAGGATQLATYLSGSNGTVTNTAEPVLPLELRVVTVPGLVVRGVGFRSGRYTDLPDIVPLTGRSTAEIRGVSPPFLSDVFYPVQIAHLNYFDRLGRPADGITRLAVTPAQFRSATPGSNSGTLRRYDELGFRLYYSANTTRYPTSGKTPALAGAPTISGVNARVVGDTVRVAVTVQSDPAAGIQEVWLTYTASVGPFAGRWQSLDLTQHPADTTRWEGTLPLAATPPDQLRFMVQAVSGVGLVTLASNQGAFFTPAATAGPVAPTALAFVAPPTSGAYGSQATFIVQLTAGGAPLPNQTVAFAIGAQRRQARTGADGRATAPLALLGLPGPTEVRAAFAGTAALGMAAAATPFTIAGQATTLTLTPADPTVTVGADTGIVAALGDGRGRALGQRSLVVTVTGTNGSYTQALITDHLGQVALGATSLPPGRYIVTAYFGGLVPLSGGAMTVDVAPYAPAQATTSLTIVAPSGTVRGRVFVDGNRSGQPEPTEQLAMATVFLDSNGNGRHDPDEWEALSTTAGTTWNYQFEGVAAGTPRVCIDALAGRLLTSSRCQTVALGPSTIVDNVDFGLVTPTAGCSAGGVVHTIAAVAPVGSAAYYEPLDLHRPGTSAPWIGSRLLIQATTNNPVVAARPGERVVNALLLSGVDAAAHPHLALRLQYQRSFQKILRVIAADGTIATTTGGTRLPASPPSGFQYIDLNGTLTIYNVPVVDGVHQDLYIETEITATAGFITATASIAGTISATGITSLGNTCGDRADTTIFAGTPSIDYGPFPGRAPVDLVPVLPF